MALIAFNLGQPGIQTDTASAFNKWYQTAAAQLAQAGDAQGSHLSLRLTVTVQEPVRGDSPTVWNLPTTSLNYPEERENIARALQLIRESGVFGFAPLRNPTASASLLALRVHDATQHFEIVVPLQVVEESIQLQNLLKLLEIYSMRKDTHQVEPARL